MTFAILQFLVLSGAEPQLLESARKTATTPVATSSAKSSRLDLTLRSASRSETGYQLRSWEVS